MFSAGKNVVQTNWQTVDITGPLSSVRQICLPGNKVLFGAQGRVIYNIDNVCLGLVGTTERYEELLTGGMSRSFADDSLVRNPVSLLSSHALGESE